MCGVCACVLCVVCVYLHVHVCYVRVHVSVYVCMCVGGGGNLSTIPPPTPPSLFHQTPTPNILSICRDIIYTLLGAVRLLEVDTQMYPL